MRDNIKILLSDSVIKISFYITVVLLILQVALTGLFFRSLPPVLPFFNSQPWGEERLFSAWGIFIIPIVLFAGFILNNILASVFYKKNTLIARMISFNALLFVILGFLAFLQILLLVF